METPRSPNAIESRIAEGLDRIATAMRADDWNRARALGLNPTQFAILVHLQGRSAGAGVKDIALQLGVSQPSATDSINALERKGLVQKHQGVADRRAVHVVLTTDGLSALNRGQAETGEAGRAITALPAPEQEQLLVTLVGMIRHLQEAGTIPIQRMCVSCRHFRPNAHADAHKPHHCTFVDAAFGQQDLRVDCRDHETADPSVRAATWTQWKDHPVHPA